MAATTLQSTASWAEESRVVLNVSWGDDARVAPGDDGFYRDRILFLVVGGVRLTMSG